MQEMSLLFLSEFKLAVVNLLKKGKSGCPTEVLFILGEVETICELALALENLDRQ